LSDVESSSDQARAKLLADAQMYSTPSTVCQ